VNAIAAYLKPPDASLLDVAVGTDITYWYSSSNYCSCRGRDNGPWTSCMRSPGLGALGRFRAYEESAKMLIRTCETCKKLKGRAILWEDNDGDKFIDRIYATTTIAEEMRQWAQANGYTTIYGLYGRNVKNFSIEVSATGMNNMPYFDSLTGCRRCNRVNYGANNACYNGTCTPHGKTFDIPLGKMPTSQTDSTGYCEVCEGDLDDDGNCEDHGRGCDGCGTVYCHYAGQNCPNECRTCPDCDAVYPDGDECPNMTMCEGCGGDYCRYGTCPNATWCADCRGYYCNASEHPDASYCEECGEYYCAGRYGSVCPNSPLCVNCSTIVPCEDVHENRRLVRDTLWPYSAQMCEDCANEYDEVTALMEHMIVPEMCVALMPVHA
jgi:hypothetical protein